MYVQADATEKTFLAMESLQTLSAKALLRSGVPAKWKERLHNDSLTRCACDYDIALYSTNDTTEKFISLQPLPRCLKDLLTEVAKLMCACHEYTPFAKQYDCLLEQTNSPILE